MLLTQLLTQRPEGKWTMPGVPQVLP